MSEQVQSEEPAAWAPGNWHAAYDAMVAKLHSHPFWKRRCDGTPLHTDIPVRATQLAMEWLAAMSAGRDALLDGRDAEIARLRKALLAVGVSPRSVDAVARGEDCPTLRIG